MTDAALTSRIRRHGGRLRIAVVALPIAMLASFAGQAAAPIGAAAAAPAPYYLALGDLLAQGVQPDSTRPLDETNRGYVDDLYAFERTRIPTLRLRKLGCPGETTDTMIGAAPAICTYALGNQLAQAVAFITTHRVAFITIDIGANNVDNCITTAGIDLTCIGDGLASAEADLPVILETLRTTAPLVPVYAMNYYDPYAAEWLAGASGQALAKELVCLTTGFGYPAECPIENGFDGLLDTIYSAFSVPVANVAQAFHTNDFATIPFLGIPVNVALICVWTWMCVPAPLGPNIHATDAGYAVIAYTFARKIGHR